MDCDIAFKIANTGALICWLALMFLPRREWLMTALRRVAIGSICVVYSCVIFFFVPNADGGGFESLQQIRLLFASDEVLFAAWLHYLAFDLFVGLWISEQFDLKKIHRVLQIPVLAATFLLGPFGLLLYFVIDAILWLHRKGTTSTDRPLEPIG